MTEGFFYRYLYMLHRYMDFFFKKRRGNVERLVAQIYFYLVRRFVLRDIPMDNRLRIITIFSCKGLNVHYFGHPCSTL